MTALVDYGNELREVSEKLDMLIRKLEQLREDMECHDRLQETRGDVLEKLGFGEDGVLHNVSGEK